MYEGIASSPMLVVLVVIGLIAIILFSLVFFLRAYKRCREFGMSKEALMRIIRSSLIFSIVPSIAIVIGLFTLSAVFGIIWPWWRLSVIGSVAYELMAGQTAAEALHGEQTATAFIAIMFAMTLGMTANIVAPIIVGKKLGSGVKKTEGENPGWKLVLNSTFWTTMLCVWLPMLICADPTTTAVLFTSAVISALIGVIATKMNWKWLNECNLAFTMILGMMSSLIWVQILG